MTNVLLAIDGELFGNIIADFVLSHQWAPNTKFEILQVIEPFTDEFPADRFEGKVDEAAKQLLMDIATRIHRSLPEVNISQIVRTGDPTEVILQEAAEWPAQLIVLGSHGRNQLKRASLGSVSLAVLTRALCPAVIVRIPQSYLQALVADSIDVNPEVDSTIHMHASP
jgi:nucleotide-binding universal stress UspA family protein